jgi:hypothetical protein
MSTVRTNNILDASGGNTATINSMTPTADSLQGFRNRIINGDMRIDQRNAGASVTPALASYTLDRWATNLTQASKFSVQRNAGSVTPPTGFTNYLGVTSLSAYSVVSSDFFAMLYNIEGLNVADLEFGTASAKTVTLSFWVRSSLTGTFGGSLTNSAINRSYPYSYTISSVNTWEQKTITITGDTTGTWLTDNGVGLRIYFGLGAGATYTGTAGAWAAATYIQPTGTTSVVETNGATFYITGVQLEVGSVATPFERRDYGRELIMCQRYYYRNSVTGVNIVVPSGYSITTTVFQGFINFPVSMRTSPTALEQSGTASNYVVERGGNAAAVTCSAVPAFGRTTTLYSMVNFTVASGLVNGGAGSVYSNAVAAYLGWSAEL